ncbi:hypothetical protein [Proteus columbae]|uniref:hypothetical protein n=1 Tax=Proteus columbae TaxID=1987580 RepID=UPI00288C6245|nr:hypothetical protein [Proteus columbae]
MRLTESQINRALRLGDEYKKADGVTTFKALLEIKVVDTQGAISETEFLTTAKGVLKQGDIVLINEQRYRVQYIADDNSGLIDAYIALSGGQHAKYR